MLLAEKICGTTSNSFLSQDLVSMPSDGSSAHFPVSPQCVLTSTRSLLLGSVTLSNSAAVLILRFIYLFSSVWGCRSFLVADGILEVLRAFYGNS